MVVKDPAVQAEEYQQALAQAKTMVGSSVVLRSGDRIWSLTPEQIAAYMDFAAEDRNGVSTLVPYLSAKKMGPYFKNIAAAVDSEPVDATFKSDGKQAWVVPGVLGKAVDRVETAKALTAAALKATERIAKVAVTTTEPDRTTQEAEAMGITDNLGGFTTKWEGTADRQTNVRITTEYASDVILAPGEVYDFDKQVGPRTEERGYKMAPGIVGPGTLEDVFGGGICQVSTTLFNAVFFAGLEVLERKNHSIYIEHYPKGRDATVSAGSPNLRFRNDTKHHILIRGSSTGIVTTFNIYGTDEGRTVTYTTSDFYDVVEREVATFSASWLGPGTTVIKLAGQEGKKIDVIRTVKAKDGSVIHKDTFVSTWRMIPQEVQVGTGYDDHHQADVDHRYDEAADVDHRCDTAAHVEHKLGHDQLRGGLVDPILLGRVDHGQEILLPAAVGDGTDIHDVAATLARCIDEPACMSRHFLRRACVEEREGHVPLKAGDPADRLLGSGHVGLIEEPHRPALRQVHDELKPGVVASLGEEEGDGAPIDQPEDYLA